MRQWKNYWFDSSWRHWWFANNSFEEQHSLGKPQIKKCRVYLGIAQMGGGVSTLAQMVWGTYFEKNCPCSKGHLLGLGGLNPCQDGLGHLCSEN